MSYHIVERKVVSTRSYKRPLYTGNRVYRNMQEINGRIRHLCYEYGEENVVRMPQKNDPTTVVVYIRVK